MDLPFLWGDDDAWKDGVLRPSTAASAEDGSGDQRSQRRVEPAWQSDDDRLAAEARHAEGPCGECVGAE